MVLSIAQGYFKAAFNNRSILERNHFKFSLRTTSIKSLYYKAMELAPMAEGTILATTWSFWIVVFSSAMALYSNYAYEFFDKDFMIYYIHMTFYKP